MGGAYTRNVTGEKTYVAGAALAEARRVKLTTGKLAYAGSTDVEVGTLRDPALAADQKVAVILRTAQGTVPMIAAGAIAAHALVYAAANGKVADSGTVLVGRNCAVAATADGDVIEVLRIGEASNAAANGGTTAAAFEVDSDATTPKLAIAGQSGGTGDYTTTIKPATTLTADRAATINADADVNLLTDHVFSATPDSSAGAGNSIPVSARCVNVGAPANNADDFIVLPAIAGVPMGHTIVINCNGGSNFEMRTPASSNTKINDVDADGTQEYLCTDTHQIIVRKHTTTGWVAQSLTKLGAVVTAVVPD